MTDIVERLHMLQSGAAWYCEETTATLEDAADEIERLLAERDLLREALRTIAARGCETFHINPIGGGNICVEGGDRFAHERDVVAVFDMVRAALKETGHERH
jgi:hypothetical protein